MKRKYQIFICLVIMAIIIITAILLKFPPSFEEIETKEVKSLVIEKNWWFTGPFTFDDDGPWWYHNYAKMKIEGENGRTYTKSRYLYTTYMTDLLSGYNKGDRVICSVTLDDSRLICVRRDK